MARVVRCGGLPSLAGLVGGVYGAENGRLNAASIAEHRSDVLSANKCLLL
jgi:hypothetical protein